MGRSQTPDTVEQALKRPVYDGMPVPGQRYLFKDKRLIGPWGLTQWEARCLDLMTVFGTSKKAGAYAGFSPSTIEGGLLVAYEKMGITEGSRRNQALRAWMEYWRTDEAKATLRNVLLTAPALT